MSIRHTNAPDNPSGPRRSAEHLHSTPPERKSSVKSGTRTFHDDPSGLTPDAARDWLDIQIPFPNRAGSSENLDTAALGHCKEIVEKFQSRISPVHDMWSVVQHFIRGTTTNQTPTNSDESHEPELFIAHETIVPRVEEEVFRAADPWFKVKGRERMDKDHQDQLRDFLDYQLDQIEHTKDASGNIGTLVDYSIVFSKVAWSTEIDRTRVKRKHEKKLIEGSYRYVTSVESAEEVVFNGPKAIPVDNFDMIFDTDRTRIRDMAYVGNWTRMPYSQIENYGRLGYYHNWQDLYGQKPLGRWDYRTFLQEERKLDYGNFIGHQRAPESGDQIYEVLELWGPFDIHENGMPVECVITIANNNVILQIRENYHDDKHRPYAMGRCPKDPFQLLGTNGFYHGARVNAEMDFHAQLASASHENTITPYIVTSLDNDMPEFMMLGNTAKVLQVSDPKDVKTIQMDSTLNDFAGYRSIQQNKIEECTGATKAVKGSGQSDTATENINDKHEAARRLRAYVTAYCDYENEILRQFHSLNRQFCTGPMPYLVLGKRGAALGDNVYQTLDPELLNHDIDFEFAATGSLQSGELRRTELLQYLNVAHPFIALNPGAVNVLYMLRELAKTALPDLDAEKIIKIPTAMDELLTQEQENILLFQGKKVPVDPLDDDAEHLEELQDVFDYIDAHPDAPEQVLMAAMEHESQHKIQMKRKQQAQRAANAQAPSFPPGDQQALTSQRGTTGNQQGSGNGFGRFEGASAAPGGGAGGMFGQTPGPGTGGQVPSADRQMGATQRQNTVPVGGR